jgi:hypothetical protein
MVSPREGSFVATVAALVAWGTGVGVAVRAGPSLLQPMNRRASAHAKGDAAYL